MPDNLANPAITHLFVLMLENRSFDHLLGWSDLKGKDATTGADTVVNGLNTTGTNSFQGKVYPATRGADNVMPFDPGHEFRDVLEQLCGATATNDYKGGKYPPIDNSGFVSNYATTHSSGEGGAKNNFGEIMKAYNPTQLPVLMTLASEFAVCDSWYSSLPGPTWPNRFFVHAASSNGLDHSPTLAETTESELIKGFSFANGTIFQSLSNHGKTWRLYRGKKDPLIGSIPIVAGLKGITLSKVRPYEQFKPDLNGSYDFQYTFIEPNYGDIINSSFSGGQSQHPMDDVRNGEALIKDVYETIRNSPVWESSMLIVTYDEHGGFYDHVAPPPAVAPGDTTPGSKYNQYRFPFTNYGVRVPAIIISPYTAKGSISHTTYDHASIPATIEILFGLDHLTNRDKAAVNLTGLAALAVARTDCPTTLPNPSAAAPGVAAEIMALRPAVDEATTPIDGGNLPGFLHVVMKAEHEEQTGVAPEAFMLEQKTTLPITKADARSYLERTLPRFQTK
jgi:phospholipase C